MTKRLIRFDWAIKRLLRNKANFIVLEGFLSELLFERITIIRILESESNQETDTDKYNRVDILTENTKGELIIIEIQNTYEIDYFHRMTYGVSKTIAENISLGQPFEFVKKVISVNIVYFDLGQGKDYIYHGKTEFTGLHEHDILQLSVRQKEKFKKENVAAIFPEYYLLKVNSFSDTAKDTLDEWMYFLKNSAVKQEFTAHGLKEAAQVLDIMQLSPEEQYSYNRHLYNLHLKASEMLSMREEAEYQIKMESKKEVVNNCIQLGYDNNTIARITGLPIEEIERLRLK